MKHIKSIIYTSLLTPIAITPCLASGCSVFTDCFKEFKPSYEQLSGSLNAESARTKWFEKANSLDSFFKDEMFWSNHVSSLIKTEGTIESVGLTYKSYFSQYLINYSYAKVSGGDQKLLSYKFNAEVEEKDEYYRDGQYIGYGLTHYSVSCEIKNLSYDVGREYNKYLDRTFWLIKPVKYDIKNGWWTDWLENDEVISFTIRELVEIYDRDGIQSYGVETTESAIMDKNISYVCQMGEILDYFFMFWSYYLDPCTYVE